MSDATWWQDFIIDPAGNAITLRCPKDAFVVVIINKITIRELRIKCLDHLKDPNYVNNHNA